MARYIIILGGTIVAEHTAATFDADTYPGQFGVDYDTVVQDDGNLQSVGQAYNAALFAPAPPPVTVITPRQARLQLINMGRDGEVETVLASLPAAEQAVARAEWEYASELKKDHPTLVALATQMAIDLDLFFEDASKL